MATTNYFRVYLSQVFALAETLVIKSESSAIGINKRIAEVHGPDAVNEFDKTTWKYYKNLAGEYHEIDTVMTVISLDTLEEIEFTKENLKVHRATEKNYQYGTRYYLELLNRYPQQEMLIQGILYPVDINKAIEAKDGTILSYPSKLVEFNEYSFISKLQEWIFLYKHQYRNPQYGVSDELFEAANLALFYIHLVPAILNIRLKACRTNEAHSFHVRRYLASHGFLDEFLDHLTTKQALWCYRNINYIERYAGHKDTFDWLIENILTERNIPIGEYVMHHDTALQPNGVEEFNLENIDNGLAYYPDILFKKNDINPIVPIAKKNPLSLDGLFTKEDPLAIDNSRFHDDDKAEAKVKMENSLANKLMTKVLESSMYDYTDSDTFTLSDILINQWIYRAFTNTYKAMITSTNPLTGERIPLNAKDSIYLLYYLFRKALGQDVEYIPVFTANRVPRVPTPDFDDLRKHTPENRISNEAVQVALDLIPMTGIAYSIDKFYEDCNKYWVAANLQNNLIRTYDHLDDRAYAENMINRIYGIYRFAPDGKVSYKEWLAAKSINISNLSQEQYAIMFTDLLREGTGEGLNNSQSTRSLQKALISLFKQLSSYSIQFITDINKSNIRQMGGNNIRVGNRDASIHTRLDITEVEVEVLDWDARVRQSVDLDAASIDAEDEFNTSVYAIVEMPIADLYDREKDIGMSSLRYKVSYQIPLARIEADYTNEIYPNKWNVAPTWGTEDMLNLTEDEMNKVYDLVDVYQGDYGCTITSNNEEQIDLTRSIFIKQHPGLILSPVPGDLFVNDVKVMTKEKLEAGHYFDENNRALTNWDELQFTNTVTDRSTGDVVYTNTDYANATILIAISNRFIRLNEYVDSYDLHRLHNKELDGFR